MWLSLQRRDTFAVCTNCSRLSHNLLNCDKCGCPLSADNESVCYSAEPKRVRPPTMSSHSNSVNGGSVAINSSANATVLSRAVAPIPQGLFVNNSLNPSTAAPATNIGVATVRPQALFVNRNNQVHTARTVSVSGQSIAATTVATAVSSRVAVPSTATNHVPTVNAADAATRLSHPAVVSSDLGKIASLTSDHRPSLPSSISSATNGQLVSSNHQSGVPVGPGANASTTEVTINAYQIRIGTRKFVPISPVSFKEDGILFTLKGLILFLFNSLHCSSFI